MLKGLNDKKSERQPLAYETITRITLVPKGVGNRS